MYHRKIIAACGLSVVLAAGSHKAHSQVRTVSAEALMSSICVNTHLGSWDASYGQIAGSGRPELALEKIESELAYLGIDCIRDTLEFSWEAASFRLLAQKNIKFDLFIGASRGANPLPIQIRDAATLVPHVLSIEGPNENDNWPVTFADETGAVAARLQQQELYRLVHNTPALSGLPVIELSLGKSASYQTFANLGNADFGNTHSYFFDFGQPVANQIPLRVAEEGIVAPNLPTISTEAGWESPYNPAAYGSVDPPTQAKLILDLLFDQVQAGVARTYIYQLMDEPQLHDRFGLMRQTGAPKLIGTALHALHLFLKNQTQIKGGSLITRIGEAPPTVHTITLKFAGGNTALVLWNEAPVWDSQLHTPLFPLPVEVTVSVHMQAEMCVFDPMLLESGNLIISSGQIFKLNVPDHPIIAFLASPGMQSLPPTLGHEQCLNAQ